MNRTRVGIVILALLAIGPLAAVAQKKPEPPKAPAKVEGTVYLSPTCGCCSKWVEHMQAAGFNLKREVTEQLETVPVRQRVPATVRTCHTAVIGNYLIEGHVPADVVQKLLREKPAIAGIAVPGMPPGSPGMESPNPRSYSVIAFKADGTTYEFARR
jgi:hypothetical protein